MSIKTCYIETCDEKYTAEISSLLTFKDNKIQKVNGDVILDLSDDFSKISKTLNDINSLLKSKTNVNEFEGLEKELQNIRNLINNLEKEIIDQKENTDKAIKEATSIDAKKLDKITFDKFTAQAKEQLNVLSEKLSKNEDVYNQFNDLFVAITDRINNIEDQTIKSGLFDLDTTALQRLSENANNLSETGIKDTIGMYYNNGEIRDSNGNLIMKVSSESDFDKNGCGKILAFKLVENGKTINYAWDTIDENLIKEGWELFCPHSKDEFEQAKSYLKSLGKIGKMGPLGIYNSQPTKNTINIPLNSDGMGKYGWKIQDGCPTWWASDLTNVTEPNGDYTPYAYLSIQYDENGDIKWYNDNDANYKYSDYLLVKRAKNLKQEAKSPDFESGWFSVDQKGVSIKNPLGVRAFFVGYMKFNNGDIMQFGTISSYTDDDARDNEDTGMFLVIQPDKLIISVNTKNNDNSGSVAGISDGVTYSTPVQNNIMVKIVGWKF